MTTLITVAAATLINNRAEVLLAQRPAGKTMAGLWEFPGGKIDPGETPEVALCRELFEELRLTVVPADLTPLTFASHTYDDFHLLMPVYVCRRWNGAPQPQEGQAIAWVSAKGLQEYPMPPADVPLIATLKAVL